MNLNLMIVATVLLTKPALCHNVGMMTKFIPGLTLNRLFQEEVVGPLLTQYFPNLSYSSALIGYGSDVQGFDDETSTDHNWGPRLLLFLTEEDYQAQRDSIDHCLRQNLPHRFKGYSVNFSEPDLSDGGTQVRESRESGPVNHLITFETLSGFFQRYLGLDPSHPLSNLDWLSLPEQQLREVTGGIVYHDGLGTLESARAKFSYYPDAVWRYCLAAQWARIGQEEHFMGRCGSVGDELGSHLIAARLVRDLMRLAFLLERTYAPYSKWFGTAFSRLQCGPDLTPLFNQVLDSNPWQAREKPLTEAYVYLAERFNALGLTDPVPAKTTDFFGRPFQVIFGSRFSDALLETINDEDLLNIPATIGGVDQFVDCTDFTENTRLFSGAKTLLEFQAKT